MPEDLTPRIISMTDSATLDPGNVARQTTVVRFMLGRFGPFDHTFPRGPQRHEIEAVMNARKLALEGMV
jgi:hypothetical protein